VTIDCQCR